MGTTRRMLLYIEQNEPDDFYWEIPFGTYILMFYYAKQINYEKAKLLYDATQSEYYYRSYNNLPLEELTDEDYECHFNIAEFQQAITFIENELIPELNNEKQDLIEKYGGKKGFDNKFYEDSAFIRGNIYDEYYGGDAQELVGVFNHLKGLLYRAIITNKAYCVSIY